MIRINEVKICIHALIATFTNFNLIGKTKNKSQWMQESAKDFMLHTENTISG